MKTDSTFFIILILAFIIQSFLPSLDREIQKQIASSLKSISISLEHLEPKK